MKQLTEFIFEQDHRKNPHGILEMSRVSHPTDNLPNNAEVWVYGENDEQGTNPPHFHIKINNKLEFEVKFNDFGTLEIWRSKTDKKDWNNYSKVRKAIIEWLTKKSKRIPQITNKRLILTDWNGQNPNHEIDVDQYIKDE